MGRGPTLTMSNHWDVSRETVPTFGNDGTLKASMFLRGNFVLWGCGGGGAGCDGGACREGGAGASAMSVPLSLFWGALSAFLNFLTQAYSAVSVGWGADMTWASDSARPSSTSPSGSGGAGVFAGTAGGAGVSVCPALPTMA